MELIILGAAAGGGLPQWNCAGGQSHRVWTGQQAPQTQASVAIGSADSGYVVINASPDLRTQIQQTPALHPRADHPDGLRNTPIRSVVLTNADVDNVAGLLNLREKQRFQLFGPKAVLDILAANSIFDVLDPAFVTQRPLDAKTRCEPITGVTLELFPVSGKPPLYLEQSLGIESGLGGYTSGVEIRTANTTVLVISSCASIDEPLKSRIAKADLLLFDGTVFNDTEMLDLGLGSKTGRRMGHLPITDANGPLVELAPYRQVRKLFFHINNTNPIWDTTTAAHRHIVEAGWEVSYDGLVIPL